MNYNSQEWAEVSERITKEIERLKESLIAHSPEFVTANYRGQVSALRSILRWPETDKANATDDGVEFGV